MKYAYVILFDSEVHRAVSMGSPSQAAANGAFLQWRSLYLLPLPQEADGSHSDHSPQSDQASEPGKRTTIMNNKPFLPWLQRISKES